MKIRRLFLTLSVLAVLAAPQAFAARLRVEFSWNTNEIVCTEAREVATSRGAYACIDTSVPGDVPRYATDIANSTIAGPASRTGPTVFEVDPLDAASQFTFIASIDPELRRQNPPQTQPTTVTVNIYLDGTLVRNASRVLGLPEDRWQKRIITGYPDSPATFLYEVPPYSTSFRVLVNKARVEDQSGFAGYPSAYQVPSTGPAIAPTFRIHGAVERDGVNVVATVYARVVDPPSIANYEQPSADGDNLDPALPRGRIYTFDGAGTRIDEVNGVLTFPSNADNVPGRVVVYLETSANYAGENYKLEIALDPGFQCLTASTDASSGCPQSAQMITWKRVYVEQDRMFRKGSFISSAIAAGSRTAQVVDRVFRAGDRVRFIHAPFWDGSGTANINRFYYEDRTVAALRGSRSRPEIELDSPLNESYVIDTTHINTPAMADAVGIINTGGPSDYYDAAMPLATSLFETAFTEYVVLPERTPDGNRLPYLPYVPNLELDNQHWWLPTRWSEVRIAGRTRPNHQYVAIGSARTAGFLGETNLDHYAPAAGVIPFSWVFRGEIERAVAQEQAWSGANATHFANETLTHELVHTWDVHPPTSTTGGHCSERAWDSTTRYCVMYSPTPRDRADGVVQLHGWSSPTSEYRRIRSRPEPLPTVSQR